MKKLLLALLLIVFATNGYTQTLTGTDNNGNTTQFDNQGNRTNNSFNPNHSDTTKKSKTIPKGIYVWRIDRKLGDIIKADVDTLPHLYPHTTLSTGIDGSYNTLGTNYTVRLSRIFIDRRENEQFIFNQLYSQAVKAPDELHFTNTLSPITNLSYDNCGDKQNGEDHIDAKFAVNAGKRIGLGFDIDYDYARGYFLNQSVSHFNATLYGSYLGDKYQLHAIYTRHYQKASENGGITNDDYITHPEQETASYADNEIPVNLSSNWNRNNSHHIFLTHRYNLGFYREVKMTEEEIKARQFAEKSKKESEKSNQKKGSKNDAPKGRPTNEKTATGTPQGRPANATIAGEEPKAKTVETVLKDSLSADSTRIAVTSKQMADSLLAAENAKDSAAQYMKKKFVPVTSFIHTVDFSTHERIYQAYSTPANYYANTYYGSMAGMGFPGDSIYDTYKYTVVKNTLGLGLLEGFNKWAKAGVSVFATHEYAEYEMPNVGTDNIGYLGRWREHNISVGGKLSKTQGNTFHYNLSAETWLIGDEAGQLRADFSTDLNFPLWGDTVRLAAKGYLHRMLPTFFERNYHSKHLWWDNSLDMENRLRAEGIFSYEKTKTTLRVAIEEIQNYTYFGMSYNASTSGNTGLTAQVHQNSSILNVLTLQLNQKLKAGPLHWDNILTYQSSTNANILPLPKLNVFSNLYLTFVYAKVLTVELGGAATYFTSYKAPDFMPLINQFAIQENDNSKVDIGNFPIVDVYANLHLKHARFFVMMTNVASSAFNRKAFLTPHYPLNRQILKIGVSWNFFN